jgi:hypothetical protein
MGFLHSVPLAITIERATEFPCHWICGSLIEADIDGRKVSAPGYGVSSRKHRSLISSCAEAHEHFWSQPSVQYAMGSKVLKLSTLRGEPKGGISALEVVGLADEGSTCTPRDATGIAFGRNWHDAVEHAVLEVIERHLLSKAWKGELRLLHIGTNFPCSQRVMLHVFCPAPARIPMAIALIGGRGFLSLGAKCSSNFDHALSGAVAEAVMLHNEYMIPDDGPARAAPFRHLDTVRLLRNPGGIHAVLDRFHRAVIGLIDHSSLPKSCESAEVLIRESGLRIDDFEVATFGCDVGDCVRVLNRHALNPKDNASCGDLRLPLL